MSMQTNQPASFLRRLGGIFYDFLLSISFVLVAYYITSAVLSINGVTEIKPGTPLSYIMFLYLIFLFFVFFGWFWTHGGQTLGMRAWRMQIVNLEGQEINWLESLARFGFAALLPGISQLWSLFDKDKMALHDRLSRTRLIYLGKLEK